MATKLEEKPCGCESQSRLLTWWGVLRREQLSFVDYELGKNGIERAYNLFQGNRVGVVFFRPDSG